MSQSEETLKAPGLLPSLDSTLGELAHQRGDPDDTQEEQGYTSRYLTGNTNTVGLKIQADSLLRHVPEHL